MKKISSILIGLCIGSGYIATSQSFKMNRDQLIGANNAITTAVPFLTIAPESRSGGMGEVGAATEVDVWSIHWNAAKLAYADKDMSVGLAYTPWLRNIGISDIDLVKLAGYKKIDKMSTVGASLLYFSMGNIVFTNINGEQTGQEHEPKEFAVDLMYSRKLSEKLSMSTGPRFIYSNLTGGASSNPLEETKPGRTVAFDIGWFYKDEIKLQGNPADLTFGLTLTNMGGKIGYADVDGKDFIPASMRLGAGLKGNIDAYNALGVYVDFNKYLVPTPPHPYEDDSTGVVLYQGRDNDVSVPAGIFQSFSDAPGGFREEMHEVQFNVGAEYWYNQQFAVRAGYSHEHETKGGRKFYTIGFGLRLNVFGMDFSYLIPTIGTASPLANTLRFALNFDVEGLKNESEVPQ